jgi:hypothetical protein
MDCFKIINNFTVTFQRMFLKKCKLKINHCYKSKTVVIGTGVRENGCDIALHKCPLFLIEILQFKGFWSKRSLYELYYLLLPM